MSRAQNGPDYDFGPYEDEYRGFEIRDDDSGRGPLILILALGVLLIFAGVVWNTYRQGVRPAEGGLPVIASDDAPYKRSPDERGGLEVAGQDKGYYDSMDGLGDPAMQQAAARDPVDIRRRATPTLEGGPLPPIEQSDDTSNTELADTSEPTVEPASDDQQIRIAAVQPVTPATRPQAPAVSAPSVSRFAASGHIRSSLQHCAAKRPHKLPGPVCRIARQTFSQGRNLTFSVQILVRAVCSTDSAWAHFLIAPLQKGFAKTSKRRVRIVWLSRRPVDELICLHHERFWPGSPCGGTGLFA